MSDAPDGDILDLVPEDGTTDLQKLILERHQVKVLRLMVNQGEGMTIASVVTRPISQIRDSQGLVDADQVRQAWFPLCGWATGEMS